MRIRVKRDSLKVRVVYHPGRTGGRVGEGCWYPGQLGGCRIRWGRGAVNCLILLLIAVMKL